MSEGHNLKGYSYPITPGGISSLVGSLPWHYATEYLTISYRTRPGAVAQFLPRPLEPGPEPDLAYVAFSKWWSLWNNQREMAYTNPERTQYKEAAVWAGCSYRGTPGQICLLIWVDNDFTLARGWFMGFPKKLGAVHITDYNALNPAMDALGPRSKLKGYVVSHGERLIEGSMTVRERVEPGKFPAPLGRPIFHLRHFPSIAANNPEPFTELVKLGSTNFRYGAECWAGSGELKFLPSEIEEHMLLQPEAVLGAYAYSSGYTFPGAEVLESSR